MKKLIALVGAAATLALATGLDRWYETLRQVARDTQQIRPPIWGAAAANLILAAALMTLAWWVLIHSEKSRLVGWILFAGGVILSIYPSVALSVHFGTFYFTIPDFLQPDAWIMHAAAFCAAIGALNLIRPAKG